MRITQGCFSFLPDLTDVQISRRRCSTRSPMAGR
jgi:hypothetical protein